MEKQRRRGKSGKPAGKAAADGLEAAPPGESPAAAFILFAFFQLFPAPAIYKYIGYYVIDLFVYSGMEATFFRFFVLWKP